MNLKVCEKNNVRNMTIIAHVNHGKTMLRKVLIAVLTDKKTVINKNKNKNQTTTNNLITLHYKKPVKEVERAYSLDFLTLRKYCRQVNNELWCEQCDERMIKKDFELVCEECGLVIEDNIDFTNIASFDQISQGIPVYAHQSSERQTKPMFKWSNGRFRLLIKNQFR